MPLYAYRCTQCSHKFEKIQSFSSKQEYVCPQCGGLLERPLTAPAFNFKGAGWYVNDYASRPSSSSDDKPASEMTPAASADSKPDSKSDSKSESKSKPASESKPAASESISKPASAPTASTT